MSLSLYLFLESKKSNNLFPSPPIPTSAHTLQSNSHSFHYNPTGTSPISPSSPVLLPLIYSTNGKFSLNTRTTSPTFLSIHRLFGYNLCLGHWSLLRVIETIVLDAGLTVHLIGFFSFYWRVQVIIIGILIRGNGGVIVFWWVSFIGIESFRWRILSILLLWKFWYLSIPIFTASLIYIFMIFSTSCALISLSSHL